MTTSRVDMAVTPHRHHRAPGQRWRQVREATAISAHRWRVRVALVALTVVFAAVLHATYALKISPAFSYLGLRYRDPNVFYYAFAAAMACVLSLKMPRRIVLPSDFVLWVMFVFATIPSVLVPQYADILSSGESLKLATFVSISFFLVIILSAKGPTQMVPLLRLDRGLGWLALAMVTLSSYAYLWYTTGLSIRLVSLASVRDLRFEFRESISEHGATLAYIVRIQGNVVNPILVALGIRSRKWALVAIGTIGQLLIFSVTGYKLILLSLPALIAVAIMFRIGRSQPRGVLFLIGTLITSLAAILVDAVRGGLLYTEIFVDRLLLTPGVLTAAHVKVFDGQPKAQWAYSFLGPFVDSPYASTPAVMVGTQFTGSSVTTANANLFADGYANLGYPGMFIEAAVLVVLLWLINSSARAIPIQVSSLILFVPSLALVNSSVFTSILSHGFLAAIVAMACLSLLCEDSKSRSRSAARPSRAPGYRPIPPRRSP